jgi:hypothetical protein
MDARTSNPARSAMAAGAAFAVLMFAGVIVFFGATPDTTGDTAGTIASKSLDYLGDSGHRTRTLVGAYLLVLASLALVWFVIGLRERLRVADDPHAIGPQLVVAFGIIAAAALAFGASIGATLAGNVSFGDEPLPKSGELAWLLPELGVPLMVLTFGLAIAACIATVSVLALRTGGLPRWVAYLGVLGVLGGVLGVMFLPMVLVMIWALIAGIAGAVGGRSTARAAVTAAPAT